MLVGLQPGGISLELRGDRLELRVSRPGKLSSVAHRAFVTGPSAVQLAVTGNGGRADLYVGGLEQESFVGKAVSPRVVRIGSLVPTRGTTLILSGVNVTTCAGQVIPAPARVAPTSASGQGGAPSPLPTPGPVVTAAPPAAAPSPEGSSGTTAEPPYTDPSNTPTWPGNPFSPTSFWNAPLAETAPLDSNSQAYVNDIVRQVNSFGSWMNTTANSVPVYVVPANEPVQHVTLDSWGPDLQSEFDAVPIPCHAKAASGSDEHMVVWQPSADKMWEFWQMRQESDGWHAAWGGEIDNVSSDPGYFDHKGRSTNWGATATGLPLLGGLITQADLQRGYINHALAISLVETAREYWSWPAQRTDGGYFTPGITPIPEGTRFRLDPTLDVAALNLPPIDRMLAQAAQTYGMVVRDQAGAVAFYGQDPVNLPSDPWPAAFGNHYPNQVLALFPWSHLQALQTQLSCCWHP